MDSDIRKWVAANLDKNHHPDQLKEALLACGFSEEEITREMDIAAPYVKALQNMKKTLHEREGYLKTIDYQMRQLPSYIRPEKTRLPPFEQFLREYYYPNRLGIFSSVLEHCEAKHWTPRSLVEKVGGDTEVEIQYEYAKPDAPRHGHNLPKYKKKIAFGEFMHKVENIESNNDFYMSAGNYQFNHAALDVLRKEVAIGDGYLVPEGRGNWLCFLIGPKGTVSDIHCDHYNNLFVQAYGRKRFRVVPAMQAPYMYNKALVHSDVDFSHPELYPDFANATVIDIELGPGDALFIPLGWWHHVTSLSPSISMSCTSFNLPKGVRNMFIDFKPDSAPAESAANSGIK